MSYTEQKTCCSRSCFSEPKGRKPDACQMQQKEPNALARFHQYLPPADVSLVKLPLAVRKIHTSVTLNICSVVVICKSASPGQVIIWPKSRAASCAHVVKKIWCTQPLNTKTIDHSVRYPQVLDIKKRLKYWLSSGLITYRYLFYVPIIYRWLQEKRVELLEGRRKM